MKTILVDAAHTFTHKVNGAYVIDADLHALLETYPNPKIVVTNANEEQQKLFGLVNLPFEMFTLSHEPDKDNPIYFQKLMSQRSLDVDDLVYFEHGKEAVESALSLGINAYHFDHEARDLDAVKVFLDSNL